MARRKGQASPATVLTLGTLALALAALASLCFGAVSFAPGELWSSLLAGENTAAVRILLHVRLPRTLGALLAGAGLSVAGVVIQSVLNNPLAGPNIIGVNAGAGLLAVLCLALFPALPGLLPAAAFLGALGAVMLVYGIARATGASRITLVLAGVAVNSFLNAGTDAVTTLVPDALLGSHTFRVGGLAGVSMAQLFPAGYYILAGLAVAWLLRNELDILSLGDDTAKSLGLPVGLFRFLLLLTAAALAGASVCFAGLLGFVGLIVPHAARFLVGSESRWLIPTSALLGATFLTLCDLLSRLIFAPFELPVGILMSFLGGPFFLWLLFQQKKGGRLHD